MNDAALELSALPSDWDIKPLFAVARETAKKNVGLVEQNLLSLSYGKIIRKDINTSEGLLPESFEGYQIVEKGDTVLRLTDLQNDKRSLRTGLVQERGIITSAYVGVRPERIDPRFFARLLYAYDVNKAFYAMGGGLRQGINFDELKRLPIPLPPLAEQRRIADFLDDQVTRIDQVSHLRKRQATLLSRRRNHPLIDAVSDLGEQVPSPIDWFPSWQSDWRRLRLSWIAKCFDGRRIPLSAQEREGRAGPYPYFGASTVVDHIDDYLFDGDYILVGEDGASLENEDFDVVQQVRGRFWVNNHAHVLQGTEVENAYLAEFLRCVDRPILISGATRPKITQEDLMSISVAVPGPDVRSALTAACVAQREASARLEGRIRHSVELLQERKRSLITAAVTGEFDVSTASIRASEVATAGGGDQ